MDRELLTSLGNSIPYPSQTLSLEYRTEDIGINTSKQQTGTILPKRPEPSWQLWGILISVQLLKHGHHSHKHKTRHHLHILLFADLTWMWYYLCWYWISTPVFQRSYVLSFAFALSLTNRPSVFLYPLEFLYKRMDFYNVNGSVVEYQQWDSTRPLY